MKRALLIGASGGIGSELGAQLAQRGYEVVPLTRRDHGFDLTAPEAAEAHMAALAPAFDLIFVASGVLNAVAPRPEKSLRELGAAEMMAQFAVNTIGPALVLKHAARLLPRDRRAVFAVLSARVGSIGDNRKGGWYSYRAAKAALNQIVHTGAIELARSHKQAICVSLHPGTVGTEFSLGYNCPQRFAPERAARQLLDVIDGLSPADSGGFYDWQGKSVPW
ncbi:SDR family NAD(P)-dependent oxidoreductase [Cognatishimia sp. SS12]|uniref:SDR family NAD(P)-dependent oxidoreductase n=1 Tax=Cognatishimia sp. SS12 TaxID=2979465 RepID=UPI00232E6863|nr:SDR family NAD(P)-dependent oxidoreductase [Cognatishimia sp. SS12]MDC0738985.1 SDR family NAD(P)-dependent oxidoreductase [Cognatishimia sp. SS12]